MKRTLISVFIAFGVGFVAGIFANDWANGQFDPKEHW